jgi:hypothetical protein
MASLVISVVMQPWHVLLLLLTVTTPVPRRIRLGARLAVMQ